MVRKAHSLSIARRTALRGSVALAAALAASSVRAATLGTYAFTGSDPAGDLVVPTSSTVIFGAFGRTGPTAVSSSDEFASDNWTTASTIDMNSYISFTVTPVIGYALTLSSVSFNEYRGSQGPATVQVRESNNSYAAGATLSPSTNSSPSSFNFTDFTTTAATTFRFYGYNASTTAGSFRLDSVAITGDTQALASLNASVATSPAARVMKGTANVRYGITVTNDALTAGTLATQGLNYSLSLTGASGLTLGTPSSGTNLAGNTSASHFVNVDTSTVGTKSGTLSISSTNAFRANGTVGATSVSPTLSAISVVDNRVINGGSAASPLSLGKVLTNVTDTLSAATLSSPEANNIATTITLNAAGGSVTDTKSTITIGSGSAVTFNGTTTTATRNISAKFTKSGTYTASTASITGATTKVENLTGETLQPVSLTYSANVFQPASLTANTSSTLTSGAHATITNAATSDGGQRAAARVTTETLSGDPGWSIAGLSAGTVINAGATGSATATLSNAASMLNGIHQAKLAINIEHDDQTILGTSAGDLGQYTWNLSDTITGHTGDGSATVLMGNSYAGFGTSRGTGMNTAVTLLGGTAGGSDHSLSISFAGGNPSALSDVVNLSGTNTDRYVMQLSYDPTQVGSTAPTSLFLGWLNPATGQYVNSVFGDSDGGASQKFISGAYNGQLTLGDYGVDATNHTVWAVIDHNSTFAVEAVPEPTTFALAIFAGCGLMLRRRRVA